VLHRRHRSEIIVEVALFAYLALGVLIVLIAVAIALRPWPFRPSLTVDELNGFARLNAGDAGSGTEAMLTFYGWRQEQWNGLARGFGALAVALLLALVGATLDAGKIVTEATTPSGESPTPSDNSKTTTTTSKTSPEVLALAEVAPFPLTRFF
jgi:hypothetical protein